MCAYPRAPPEPSASATRVVATPTLLSTPRPTGTHLVSGSAPRDAEGVRWFPVDVLMVSLFSAIGRTQSRRTSVPVLVAHRLPFLDGLLVGWVLIWLVVGPAADSAPAWSSGAAPGGRHAASAERPGHRHLIRVVAAIVLAPSSLGPRTLGRVSRRSSAA